MNLRLNMLQAVTAGLVLTISSLALGQALKPQPIGKPAAPLPIGRPAQPAPTPVKPVPAKPITAPIVTPVKPVTPAVSRPPVQDGTTLPGPGGFGSSGYSSAALPLASVGRQVGWRIDPDDFRVFVPQAAAGRNIALEVFSPEINRNDYANGRDRRTYYGDELYGKNAVLTTNFTFVNSGKQTLVNRTFSQSLKHSYEQLLQTKLTPGFYPLTIRSDGNGKNSYAVRVTGGARVEASQFTVNARGQFNQDQVVGFIQVDPSQLGKTVKLENYDADGNKEIVLTLVAPDGKRIPLRASEDTQWATNNFVVTQSLVGTWKLLARILPTTRQFSNAFAMRLRVGDQPIYAQIPGFGVQVPPIQAIRCEVVDPSGAPIIGATCVTTGGATRTLSPILPVCYSPVRAAVLEGVGTVVSSTQVDITSPSGAVRFVASCPAARVQVSVVGLVCGTRTPLQNISVNVGGQIVTAPATIDVNPGQVNVSANVVGATSQVVFVTAERGQTKAVTLEIAPRLNLAIGIEGATPPAGGVIGTLRFGDVSFKNPVSSLEVGDAATVVAIAYTPFTQPLTQTINVTLPVGLEATGPVRVTGNLVAGQPLILRIPVRATAALSNAQVSASLEPSCNVQASAPLTITSPPVIPPPAKLELTKTVDRDLVKPNEQPVFTIAVTNTGGSVANGVRLTDALPAGLRGTNLDQTFDLEPGKSKTVTLEATVEDSASGVIVNTAKVDWNGTDLSATAQVRVQPVIDLSITKTVSAASVKLGDGASYTLLISNAGPSVATNVVVSDALPAGLTYVSSSATQGTTSDANGVLTANIGTLAKGASASVTVRVNTTRAGSFTNTATVSGSEAESSVANNRSSALLEVTVTITAPPVVTPPAVIPNGTLSVTQSANVCGAVSSLTGAGFSVNGQRYSAPATVSLAPGVYSVQPDALAGSTANPISVTIASNQTASVNLVHNVALSLSLEPATLDMTAGETTTLTATASTAFPYPVAATIDITIPATFTTTTAKTVSGLVSSGKPLVLAVPVRATQGVTGAVVRSSLQSACGISDSSVLNVKSAPLPDQFRESNVVLLAKLGDVPTQGYVAQSNALILSDRIPANASYVVGSSRLLDEPTFDVNTPTNAAGKPIADPFVTGDRLFWIIPLKNGAATLKALQAKGQITMRRDTNGQNVYGIAYKLAHTGPLVMPEDRIAVLAAIPSSRTANAPRTTTIAPDSPLAKLVGAGDLIVLQGGNSILILLAQAVQFSGNANGSNLPALAGGPATTVRVSLVRGTTDSIDGPQILIAAFDANGLPANDPFATLESSVDILDADADPATTGYQVRLTNGVGKVRVANLSGGNSNANANPIGEVRIEARVSNVNGSISSSEKFTAASFTALNAIANSNLEPATTNTSAVARPFVGAGTLGIGGSLDLGSGAFTASGGLRYFLRGEIAPGLLLTLGINWQAAFDATTGNFSLSGNLMPSANPYDRFPLLGDSSVLGSDVRSTEGLYFKIETGSSYLLFGQFNPSFRGILSGYGANYNGFQGVLRDGDFAVNAFITDVPSADQRLTVRADGSDLYFLPVGGIAENSERIVVVTRNRLTGQKLTSRLLTRNADYAIDYLTGIVRLRQAVLSTDNDLNPVFVEFEFAATGVKRDLRAGAQVSFGSGDALKVTATALQFRNGQFGANGSYLFGAGVAFSSGGFNASLEGALSGQFGNQGLGLAAQASYVAAGFGISLDYRDRDPNFVNPESNLIDSGRALTAGLLIGDPTGFRINANLLHTQEYTAGTGSTGASLEARTNLGGAFTAALGLKYLYSFPVSSNELWLTGGLAAPLGGLKLTLDGRTPLLGTATTYGGITAGIELALSDRFSLRLADKLTFEWNGIRQQLSFGVTGAFANSELLRGAFGNDPINPDAFGTTSVSASYELDSLDGDSGRARVGLETLVPLGGAFSAQLGAEAVFDPNGNLTGSTSVGLLYAADNVKGLARAQLSLQPSGVKQVYTLSVIAPLAPEFIVSPLIEYAVDPSRWAAGATSADGGRYSIAFALRSDDWSVLSNNTGRFGLYAVSGDFLEGEVQAGYQAAERLYFRSSIAYRYQLQGGTFTGQLGAGFSYFLTDRFAVGAQAGYLFNTLGSSKFAFGVEGSLRVVDNLLFTLGVNALGFNGIGNSFNPGLYFRLDWKLDERTFGFGGGR